MKATKYISGDWAAICDVCGFRYKGSELLQRWDGPMVCKADWEPRHPQEFVRGRPEKIVPPFIRIDLGDGTITLCTLANSVSIAAQGVAGCMIAGRV